MTTTEKIENAVEELRQRMYRYEYDYLFSPSSIGLFYTQDKEIEVRSHQGSGGFIDVLHDETKELVRLDTSNNESEIDEMIADGLTQEEHKTWEEEECELDSVIGEEEFKMRRQNIIDNQIEDNIDIESIARQIESNDELEEQIKQEE